MVPIGTIVPKHNTNKARTIIASTVPQAIDHPKLKQPCNITQARQDKKLGITTIRADATISDSQHRSSKNPTIYQQQA
jgi:hypothetical protein